MKGYIIAFVAGMVVATVGVGGIMNMVDNGVNKVQQYSKEAAK